MNQNLIKTFQQRGYFNQCTDLDNLKAYTFSFTNESKVANENFKF